MKQITELTTDLNNIQGLADKPNAESGLTPLQLKTTFDKTGNDIKAYINDTMIADIDDNFTEVVSDYATKAEVQGITLGQIPDNTITKAKLATSYSSTLAEKDGTVQTNLNANKLNGATFEEMRYLKKYKGIENLTGIICHTDSTYIYAYAPLAGTSLTIYRYNKTTYAVENFVHNLSANETVIWISNNGTKLEFVKVNNSTYTIVSKLTLSAFTFTETTINYTATTAQTLTYAFYDTTNSRYIYVSISNSNSWVGSIYIFNENTYDKTITFNLGSGQQAFWGVINGNLYITRTSGATLTGFANYYSFSSLTSGDETVTTLNTSGVNKPTVNLTSQNKYLIYAGVTNTAFNFGKCLLNIIVNGAITETYYLPTYSDARNFFISSTGEIIGREFALQITDNNYYIN